MSAKASVALTREPRGGGGGGSSLRITYGFDGDPRACSQLPDPMGILDRGLVPSSLLDWTLDECPLPSIQP